MKTSSKTEKPHGITNQGLHGEEASRRLLMALVGRSGMMRGIRELQSQTCAIYTAFYS